MEKSPSEANVIQTRVVPLTSEIKLAMIDFQNSKNTCDFKLPIDLTELVRSEIERVLNTLDAHIIKREELSQIISRSIEELVPVGTPPSNAVTTAESTIKDGNMKVTIAFTNKPNINQGTLQENVDQLEHRISTLEAKLSSLLRLVPILKNISANYKIDRKSVDQTPVNSRVGTTEVIAPTKESIVVNSTLKINPYDDMYYEERQNKMNLSYYKKSACSLELNRKEEPFYWPPVNNTLLMSRNVFPSDFKVKFIKSKDLLKD